MKYDETLTAHTKYGTYVGFRDSRYGVVNFRNVCFGTAKRWEPAVFPNTGEDDVFEAFEFGPAPIQPAEKWGSMVEGGMDEQCFNMNIYAKDLSVQKKAVMVWVFPGMQIIGSNQGSLDCGSHHGKSYDASRMLAEEEHVIGISLTSNTITIKSKKGKTATYPITGTKQYYQNGIKAGD